MLFASLGGKVIKYTNHGKRRAAERGITEDAIQKALSEPSFSFYDLCSAAYVAFKKLDGQHLLVVYACEAAEIRVITTFITSNAKEIIEGKLKSNAWVKVK